MKYLDFEEHVRRAIRASGRSDEQLAKRARVRPARVRAFMEGGFLSQLALERLAGALGLAFTWSGRQAVKIIKVPKAKRKPRHEP